MSLHLVLFKAGFGLFATTESFLIIITVPFQKCLSVNLSAIPPGIGYNWILRRIAGATHTNEVAEYASSISQSLGRAPSDGASTRTGCQIIFSHVKIALS